MMKIGSVTVTTSLNISFHDYLNAGLSIEDIKERLSTIRDPYSHNLNFYAENSGFYGNLIINTAGTGREAVDYVILLVEVAMKTLAREQLSINHE